MSIEHVDQAEFAFQTPRYNFGLAGGERVSVRPDDSRFELLLDAAPFLRYSPEAEQPNRQSRKPIMYSLPRQRHPNAQTYIEFRQEADKKRMPVLAIDARVAEKRDILTAYFPHRFGKDGTQPLDRISMREQHKIGVIFRKVYDHAEAYLPTEQSYLEEAAQDYEAEQGQLQHK